MRCEKAANNVIFVKCPIENIFVGISIVVGDRIAIIDTGLQSSWRDHIFPCLKSIRRNPEEISFIVNTHYHRDHVGDNIEIKRVSGAKIAAHELDAPAIEYEKEDNIDTHLRDGDVLNLGTVMLKVIHTPGHSAGSICLYDSVNRVLITGDSLQGNGTILDRLVCLTDVDAYLGSMQRLSEMAIDVLIAGHPYLPGGKGVLKGDKVRKLIVESISSANAVERRIIEIMETSKKPMSRDQITKRIVGDIASIKWYTPWTIDAYLRKLQSQNKVDRTMENGKVLWKTK